MNKPRSTAARAARKLDKRFIPAMRQWQEEIEALRSAIAPSPREDAMLEGDEEQDEATEMRALLECLSRQHLADTIAAAQQIAVCNAKEKK
jgi:hypothetical protein